MIQKAELSDRIQAVVNHQLSIEDFEDWLDGASWNMHSDSEQAAIQPASEALLLLSEYGLGCRNEIDLREEFGLLLQRMSQAIQYIEVCVRIDVNSVSKISGLPIVSASAALPMRVPNLTIALPS